MVYFNAVYLLLKLDNFQFKITTAIFIVRCDSVGVYPDWYDNKWHSCEWERRAFLLNIRCDLATSRHQSKWNFPDGRARVARSRICIRANALSKRGSVGCKDTHKDTRTHTHTPTNKKTLEETTAASSLGNGCCRHSCPLLTVVQGGASCCIYCWSHTEGGGGRIFQMLTNYVGFNYCTILHVDTNSICK